MADSDFDSKANTGLQPDIPTVLPLHSRAAELLHGSPPGLARLSAPPPSPPLLPLHCRKEQRHRRRHPGKAGRGQILLRTNLAQENKTLP